MGSDGFSQVMIDSAEGQAIRSEKGADNGDISKQIWQDMQESGGKANNKQGDRNAPQTNGGPSLPDLTLEDEDEGESSKNPPSGSNDRGVGSGDLPRASESPEKDGIKQKK